MESWAFESMQRAADHQDVRAIERATSAAAAEIKAIELGEVERTPLAQRWPEHSKHEQTTVLAAIEGVGQARAKALIEAFETIAGVFAASKDELAEVQNIGNATAMSVYSLLHGG
jgi:ERCC4-type nuclease